MFGRKAPQPTQVEVIQRSPSQQVGGAEAWPVGPRATALTVPNSDRTLISQRQAELSPFHPEDAALEFLDRCLQHHGPGTTVVYIGTLNLVQQGATFVGGNQTTQPVQPSTPASPRLSDYMAAIKAQLGAGGFQLVTEISALGLDSPLWIDLESRYDADRMTIRNAARDLLGVARY